MYSPKLPKRLIPVLYHLARARRQPMTVLVTELLEDRLAELAGQHSLPTSPPPPDRPAGPLPRRAVSRRGSP